MKNLKYFFGAAVCGVSIILFSAFGGEKVTLEQQMTKINEIVGEKVAAYEAEKRDECKAMAQQKAIAIAESKWAAESKGGKKVVAPVAKPAVATKKPVAPVKKAPAPVKPAPVVKTVPTPAPAPAPTTGRRQETNTTPVEAPREERSTGRRGGGK
jgi:hypothetical protein